YGYRLTAIADDGAQSLPTATVLATPNENSTPNTAPAAVTDLTASAPSTSEVVTLNWSQVADPDGNVTGYRLERKLASEPDDDYRQIASIDASGAPAGTLLQYLDLTGQAATAYRYRL